ncbi:hypothetical protein JN11_04858 [Mucilaginibacter frigoritolerans]|jgi:hypothetical protein|uniref:LemA protein n=1 Tax=Mucilaginibacter frigoritolerans TaxID=652788 RepID=A0A562TKI1_9SPHI|nr:hypothetical protein [Mucilaginibacter frigoritolerans]TWI94041.1 hypothetical protein JN11_04858 [Mucilaginibacter frigoritolerans]
MDIFFLCAVVGAAIVILILKFDKKQSTKVNTLLKEAYNVPPLFQLKSTEQKITLLKAALRYDDAPQNMATAGTMADIYNQNESRRQSKVQELKLLSSKYNDGQISIEVYNRKLDELIAQVHAAGGAFEVAC